MKFTIMIWYLKRNSNRLKLPKFSSCFSNQLLHILFTDLLKNELVLSPDDINKFEEN